MGAEPPSMAIRSVLTSTLIVATFLSLQSCKWLSRQNAKIDKLSPTGAYRVKFESTVEDTDRFMGFHEWGSVQYFKGAETIYSHKWDYSDSMEDTVMGMHENATWLADNILFMGGNRSAAVQPTDEITISNTTIEHLDYVTVSLAKYSHIAVFDLPAAAEIKVRVPQIMDWRLREGEIKWSFGFRGGTRSKREFAGARSGSQRSAGPTETANVFLTITEGDFR
ncbi:MAG TPA: hypothetical protein VF251_05290 [Pyrinomonadaceae bacterium]